MNTELKAVISYLTIVLGIFVSAARFISSVSNFMKYADISEFDICLILILSGLILYQGLKRKNDYKTLKTEMDKMEGKIVKECTKLIDDKIEKLTIIISNTSREVSEIKQFLGTINQNILDLAKNK